MTVRCVHVSAPSLYDPFSSKCAACSSQAPLSAIRLVLVLAIRVASYSRVLVLNPVHDNVVKDVPFKAPSIFSSIKRPPSSERIVDVPVVVMLGPPGRHKKVICTSQVPPRAVRRACSGPGPTATDLRGVAGPALAWAGTTARAAGAASAAATMVAARIKLGSS